MIKVRNSNHIGLLKLSKGTEYKKDIFGNWHLIKNEHKPMPRAWEYELAELLSTITDPTLRQKITTILELARQGWLDQNQPSGGNHEDMPKPRPENAADPKIGLNNDLFDAPGGVGTMARPGRSGMGPNVIDDKLPNPRNNSSAHVNAGKKTIRGSLLLTKSPTNFLLKSYKCVSGLCKTDLHFIASDTSIDSDNDVFTREQLETWKNQIVGLPLTFDHEHSVKSEIGVISGSDIKCQGEYCRLEATAKLYDDHEIAQQVKRSANAGRVLEFSIGATQPKNAVKDRNGVRHISDSNLLHVSIVQSGSNRNAKLLGLN